MHHLADVRMHDIPELIVEYHPPFELLSDELLRVNVLIAVIQEFDIACLKLSGAGDFLLTLPKMCSDIKSAAASDPNVSAAEMAILLSWQPYPWRSER